VVSDDEDPLLAEAKGAESLFANKEMPGASTVVESLYEKAKRFGPAVSFSFPVNQAPPVTGLIRRFDVRLIYDETIQSADLAAILKFSQSFGIGEIKDRPWLGHGDSQGSVAKNIFERRE
jgi:hypothetical protein